MKSRVPLFPIENKPYPVSRKERKFIKKQFEYIRNGLCEIFLEAVDNHDRQTILELANAVWFFKGKRFKDFKMADRTRTVLIFIKIVSETTGIKFTIRQIAYLVQAEKIRQGQKFETPADGFSSLRRQCRSLHVPFASDKDKETGRELLNALSKVKMPW